MTKEEYSEASSALSEFGRYLNESYLISVFDIHHNHFKEPENHYNNTALIFLDSGGYELNPEFDSTEPKMTPIRQLDFTNEDYCETLDLMYKDYSEKPFIMANFDWETKYTSYENQIEKAREIFNKYPNWSSNFILKPNKKGNNNIHVNEIAPYIDELSKFDIIGVTEKELGKKLLDRLKKIFSLRKALNEAGINAPIHIWGGLDPLITPLYFFAGADIFDGVSWLRYLFHEGKAVNRESYAVLTGNISVSHDHAVMLSISANLMALQGLANSLRAFANSDKPNFDIFDENGSQFEKAYMTMTAKIPGFKG